MAKLKIQSNEQGPALSGGAMFVKLMGLVVMSAALLGVISMLLTYSWEDKRESWDWKPEDIRTNFDPLMTSDQIKKLFADKRREWMTGNPINELPKGVEGEDDPRKANKPADNGTPLPFGNDGDTGELPPPGEFKPRHGKDQREETRLDEARELKLAEKLSDKRQFELLEETQNLLDWIPFEDSSREKTMNEFAAFKGRQAPTNEQLALQIMSKLPAPGAADYATFTGRTEKDGWYWGKSQGAIDKYRGHVFEVEGRLFDLYEIKPDEPIVLQDGTKVDSYYEGVVALLGPGMARGDHAVEQRVVEFQSLTVPDGLAEYVNTSGHVSHDDKLVTAKVMVKFHGAFLRRWIYSREVAPYSTAAKQVLSQDHSPLLLTPDLAQSATEPYQLTDKLLQQVKDALRDDPVFLETEAAYYTMLAKANDPDDSIEVNDEIGYFDLAGEETGPRYRGQGIRVVGMVGDNYAPVILPPNVSGLRRVFRTLVLDDTANLQSPKRYMVDMIEPPTGLEPRAIVDFSARYYRNVFETESASSTVRPLLIVRRVEGLKQKGAGHEWIYALLGVIGILLLMAVLTWFILSERRERARFEANTLELSRSRVKKGALKLKPLPGGKGSPPEAKPDPEDAGSKGAETPASSDPEGKSEADDGSADKE
ncbi:MAG: hypothetical protein KDB82_01585 [Planctomycetes bacterium]|nr:hypothetical protein [Planctomycetota bacterium]